MSIAMSWYWSDLICPWNLRRRRAILRLNSKLIVLLQANFRKTNELIGCFHEYLPGRKFQNINFNPLVTVRENCDVLIAHQEQLLSYLTEKRQKLETFMGSGPFENLMSASTTFVNKIKIARQTSKEAVAEIGTVPGMVVIGLLCEDDCLPEVIDGVRAVSQCSFSGFSISDLNESAEHVIDLIKNGPGRTSIDEAIDDVTATFDTHEPSFDKFSRTVDRMIIRIEG